MPRSPFLRYTTLLSSLLLLVYLLGIFYLPKQSVWLVSMLALLLIFAGLGYAVLKIWGSEGDARQAFGRQGALLMFLFLGYSALNFLELYHNGQQEKVEDEKAAAQERVQPRLSHFLRLPKRAGSAALHINKEAVPVEVIDSTYLRFQIAEALIGKEAQVHLMLQKPSGEVEQYQKTFVFQAPPDTLVMGD